MKLLIKCIHVRDEYELGRKEVSFESLKYATYDIDGGKERKKIQLVTSEVRVSHFIKELFKNKWKYVQHVHVARWQDEHFIICKDTFPIGIVLLVVDFSEKYTLQLQNYI